jgi:kynureninase
MPATFTPAPGIAAWAISNPPIFSTAPLLASLPLFAQVGMAALRAKSLRLTGYLESLAGELGGDVAADRDARPIRRSEAVSYRCV